MRAGFNWELGPFEMWDAAGVADSVARMKAMSLPVSAGVEKLLDASRSGWYSLDGDTCFQPATGELIHIPAIPGHGRVADFPPFAWRPPLNSGASLVDLADGIACIELHSLKNAIGATFLPSSPPFSTLIRCGPRFAGIVISGDRDNFSVGANLMQPCSLRRKANGTSSRA